MFSHEIKICDTNRIQTHDLHKVHYRILIIMQYCYLSFILINNKTFYFVYWTWLSFNNFINKNNIKLKLCFLYL